MNKHTPGPWYAYPNVLQVADKKYWFDDNGSRHGDTPNWVIDCINISDTHLIAAAPDLLAALQSACLALEQLIDIEAGSPAAFTVAKARAAIAKAEGKLCA